MFGGNFRQKSWEITSKMACLCLAIIWHESQAQDAPKTPQDAPKMATRRVKKAPKTHARHPQDAPKRPQDAFKMAQDAPKTLPRHPTRAPGRPKEPQDAYKTPQDASRPRFWCLGTWILEAFGTAKRHPGLPGTDLILRQHRTKIDWKIYWGITTYKWPGGMREAIE